MGQENLGSFHILFQGFGMLAWHCNWEASRQVNAFAKVCRVPVDIAWLNPIGATLGNRSQVMVLCPIQGSTFCQPPDGGSWQLAMAPKGQQCCCQGTGVPFSRGSSRIPGSCSSCQPLSLLTIAFPSPTLECYPFRRAPFSMSFVKKDPFSRKCLSREYLFQGWSQAKASVSVYLLVVPENTFKPKAAECQCIHLSK